MDVATPTADCLSLVHDLLAPVIMKGRVKGALSHQEVGISLCLLSRFIIWRELFRTEIYVSVPNLFSHLV